MQHATLPAAAAAPRNPGSADPLKREACIQVVVRFVDGNTIKRYSYDVQHRGTSKYQNVPYWTRNWQRIIELETPSGWSGRVESGAIFHSFDGNRGDRICQFERGKGWSWDRKEYRHAHPAPIPS